ncbi:uncharacterized protein TNCV_1885751 [Trichonephila clavipes]|nr:uncharacterized protein TNCV_1885751 [Trichonephila clavipes]
MKEGLIPSRYECQKCKKDMLLVERKGTIDGFEWRCRVQSKENPHFVCRSVRKDANNLYGWAMSQHLPTHDFSWTDEDVNFMNVPDDSEIGYIFEVDLEYPDELHDLHNCYPLAQKN